MAGVYETFYRLSSDPFRLSPDHRFCYAHPSYRKARAYMQYALQRGEGLLVVTGTPGTGKTTLIRDVCAQIDEARITLVSLLSTRLQPDDLLDMVAMGLGIASHEADSVALRSQIEIALVRQRRSRRVVLMVDEAQDLPGDVLEEIHLLSDMRLGSHLLVQVFLVGQDPLVDLIKRPDMEAVRQRIVAAAHLQPLSREDATAFVFYRLQRAGWRGDPGFTPQALASLYEFSRGVPRLINQLCSRLLFFGAVEQKHRLDGDDVDRVVHGLREEMLFGGAVAQPTRDGCRHPAEGKPAAPASGQEAIAPASACRQPRDDRATLGLGRVACAAVPGPAWLGDPLPGAHDERASVFRAVGEARRQLSSAVLLVALAASGYQLRISGNLAVREPLSQSSGDMAAFTVLPTPRSEPSHAAAGYEDPPRTVASGQQALLDGRRERGGGKAPAPQTAGEDLGAGQASASGPVAVLPVASRVSATAVSHPTRNPRPAAEPPAAVPGTVPGAAAPAQRSVSAPEPTKQTAMLKSRPIRGSLDAGVSGFGVANRQYQPEEVQAWLMSGRWTRYDQPAARLPSPLTRCRSRTDHIVCWSAPQKVEAGSRDAIYQVQATIDGFSSEGVFRVRYRVLESAVRVNGGEPAAAMRTKAGPGPAVSARRTACTAIDSTLIRCGGEVDAVFRLGWKVSGQDTTCRAITGGLVRCRGDVEGVFRLGWKLSQAEMTCRAVDSGLIRCRDEAQGVHAYRSAH